MPFRIKFFDFKGYTIRMASWLDVNIKVSGTESILIS